MLCTIALDDFLFCGVLPSDYSYFLTRFHDAQPHPRRCNDRGTAVLQPRGAHCIFRVTSVRGEGSRKRQTKTFDLSLRGTMTQTHMLCTVESAGSIVVVVLWSMAKILR